jgi:glycosyltransferase involved in cell wall biosynthesis
VVPLAVSPDFRPQPPEKGIAIRRRYAPGKERLLLHVGHTQPRKNLPTLLRALVLLRQQGTQVILAQIGGQPDASQRELIQELGLERAVHFVGPLPDKDLVTLYGVAEVFVFPSFYEGFGLPPLEAMACGVPVVCSNVASLPEVVGDAALAVDPHDVQALAEAIERVLADPALAAELRQRGLERARQFTWERTAQATLAVYREIMEETR